MAPPEPTGGTDMDRWDYVIGTLGRLDERTVKTSEDLSVLRKVQARIESTINELKNDHAQRIATLEERTPPTTSHLVSIGAGSGIGGAGLIVFLDYLMRHVRLP